MKISVIYRERIACVAVRTSSIKQLIPSNEEEFFQDLRYDILYLHRQCNE